VYLPFRVDIRPDLERAIWQAFCFFDLKEHFIAIGLGSKKWGSSLLGSARVSANFLDGADGAKQFYL
jgi:hypothetical protein